MKLNRILDNLKVIQVIGTPELKEIESFTNNSIEVKDNSVFVAVKGFKTDGHKYIIDAIDKGAIAVVLEDESNIPNDIFKHSGVVKILVEDSRKAFAELANTYYDNPSQKLKLIGITGTKGKTTTTYYLKNLFESAGYRTGLIGTIANYIGNKKIETTLTTPETNVINYYLNEMVKEGITHCVMEVSSHALSLNRVYGLDFDYAIFTNITLDHLDFHNDFENYLSSKKILFDSLIKEERIVYNSDDDNWDKLIDSSRTNIFSYGVNEKSNFRISNIEYDLNGTSFTLTRNNESQKFNTKLIGKFNAYNAASAAAIGYLEEMDSELIINGINSTLHVPGRFEVLSRGEKKVIIDYSHTADSLQKALEAIHHIVKDEKPIYTVFGCGGDRDTTKRPVMGKIASDLSDKIYITSDNPRSEDPLKIIDDILSGVDKKDSTVIENREEAIKTAISDSEENAVILVAGKGHENYQIINGIKNYFSDKEIVEKYLEKYC